MRIKAVLNILREIQYLKSVIKKYRSRLANGRYVLFDSFRAMALGEPETLERAHIYFDIPKPNARLSSIAAKLNRFGYYSNKNKKTSSEYEAFYSANNYDKDREVKLFSFQRRKILTICTSQADAETQLNQYTDFSKAYPMPTVTHSDYYPNAFEISMINPGEFPGDALALNAIAQATMRFNPSSINLDCTIAHNLVKYSYEDETINALLGELVSKIDESVLNQAFPACIQHGDLSKSNLIYGEADGKTDFWWIDWEHARERIFFYDYFFYLINSALYYDTRAYDLYMSGDVDENLGEFFAHFGLTFVPEKRRDYFLIFAVIFLKERVCDFGRVEALKQYCAFIAAH